MNLKVLQIKEEASNSTSLILERPDNLNFYPGQYLTLLWNGDDRCFSLSSSPTEEFLMMTYKKGVSDFKKYMQRIKVGDTVQSEHPAGTVTMDEDSPLVMIAGGIGITPFRSMVKLAVDKNLKIPLTLIYSNSTEDFLFKDELDQWQKSLPNLRINYIVTSQQGRLTKDKIHDLLSLNLPAGRQDLKPDTKYHLPDTIYYLAGSHGFVNDIEKMLLELKIDPIDIRTDKFDGY